LVDGGGTAPASGCARTDAVVVAADATVCAPLESRCSLGRRRRHGCPWAYPRDGLDRLAVAGSAIRVELPHAARRVDAQIGTYRGDAVTLRPLSARRVDARGRHWELTVSDAVDRTSDTLMLRSETARGTRSTYFAGVALR
jgi:hypothetical protein